MERTTPHPCAGLVGAGMESITRLPGGVTLVTLLTVGIATLAFQGGVSRRDVGEPKPPLLRLNVRTTSG
jgi:hypothetical protein